MLRMRACAGMAIGEIVGRLGSKESNPRPRALRLSIDHDSFTRFSSLLLGNLQVDRLEWRLELVLDRCSEFRLLRDCILRCMISLAKRI